MREARRLALLHAGLLEARGPRRPSGSNRRSCHAWLRKLGYLQLDTIVVTGARSHTLALLSRVEGLDPKVADDLLRPGAPLFEYWGHETSWLPMELYPVFAFRREDYRRAHPWWGPLLGKHRAKAKAILARFRGEGPLRSADFEDRSLRSDWGFTLTRRLLHALWSSGDLAVRARPGFHRIYDLRERVIPPKERATSLSRDEAIETLLLKALELHGWAETRTLSRQWRLPAARARNALLSLEGAGRILACRLVTDSRGRSRSGWIRPRDMEVAARVGAESLEGTKSVLLSPFDVLLWDRPRVQTLFGFDQILEVYKPEPKRQYGYYCMPVLRGDALVARCDLRADRSRGVLHVLSCKEEPGAKRGAAGAARDAVRRLATALELEPTGPS